MIVSALSSPLLAWIPLILFGAVLQDSKPAAGSTPDRAAAQVEAARRGPDLRTRANAAVHWIRARQDEEGTYGEDLTTTGMVLFGFARMVRQYRETDGPFISRAVDALMRHRREDGSFVREDTQDPIAPTLAAALALSALDEAKHADVVAAAVRFVARERGLDAPEPPTGTELERFVVAAAPELLPRAPSDRDAAEAMLDDGRERDGGYGSVARTASRLVLVNQLASQAPPPPNDTRPPVALPPFDRDADVDVDALLRKAIQSLLRRQLPEGGFGSAVIPGQDVGVTALVAQALWAWPGPMPEEIRLAAERATAAVAAAAGPDGAIHGGGLENYATSAAVGALVASKNPVYRPLVEKARAYLTGLQADEGEQFSPDHWAYGGWGYGNEERPDLSNTQMALDALRAAGVPPEDPAMQRVLRFLERCQNRSESNTIEIARDGVTAVAGNDGGAVYYPGKSQAGSTRTADGKQVPRSYGSMTYALLKGFVFAGLPKDDPRLQDAWKWCVTHYTLDRVPGYEEMALVSPRIAYQGLFYYYLSLATALRAYGAERIEPARGTSHDWRRELAARLASLQRPDGSFVNENSQRWYEGDEVLATSYAVLALQAARR